MERTTRIPSCLSIPCQGITFELVPPFLACLYNRSRNNPEIELGEVRIAQRLIEAQGIKFGGFLEWITPEDNDQTDVDEEETQDAV